MNSPGTSATTEAIAIVQRLVQEVLVPMKQDFISKDEIIDLMGICLVGGENLFLLGPPGTAKSALVHQLAARLEGRSFDYLLTRFTEPNELFGPFDIRRLREGELVTNTEGMLPEAALVFLDELLNANSAILNALLVALNERQFRRGRESRPLAALLFVGASNHLPEDDALHALFDRFLLRVHCDNVPAERLVDVLSAGWRLASQQTQRTSLHFDDIRRIHAGLSQVDVGPIRVEFAELIQRIRHAGITVSDRRAVKLQRVIAASALLSGRSHCRLSDLWVVRHIWDTQEQREILAGLVEPCLKKESEDSADHPRSRSQGHPDPEALARDLSTILESLKSPALSDADRSYLRDRLGILEGRCQWVRETTSRDWLASQVATAWALASAGAPASTKPGPRA